MNLRAEDAGPAYAGGACGALVIVVPATGGPAGKSEATTYTCTEILALAGWLNVGGEQVPWLECPRGHECFADGNQAEADAEALAVYGDPEAEARRVWG